MLMFSPMSQNRSPTDDDVLVSVLIDSHPDLCQIPIND